MQLQLEEGIQESPMRRARRLLKVARRLRMSALSYAALGAGLLGRRFSKAGQAYVKASRRLIWLHDEVREQARAAISQRDLAA